MVEILISSSVLILVLAILRLVLRGRIPARLQYALWLLVLIRLLVPVSFFRSPISVAEAAAPVTERAAELSRTDVEVGPFSQQTALRLIDLGFRAESVALVSNTSTEGTYLRWTVTLRYMARLVWYAGMAVMAAWFLFVNLRVLQRLKRTRTPYDPAAKPPICIAAGLPSPCLFGLFDPVIYLTEQAAADSEQVRQIIAHERTHLRHGDLVWALLRSVCLVVWWFDPFVWLAAALSRQDAELACDEGTIKTLGEEARFDYGRTLVGMTKVGAKPSDLLCGATTMTGGKKSLRTRIARIAKAPKVSTFLVGMTLVIAAVAAGCTYAGAEPRVTPGAEVEAEIAAETAPTPTPAPVEQGSAAVPSDPEPEVAGVFDRDYWEEVDRELASFAAPAGMDVSVSVDFDTAIPENDIFGPLTLEDYIYGTDGWTFRYNGESLANDPMAAIRVHDADGRTLWIMEDADALMIEETDGSITWVAYRTESVDCADMIRHLLPWARGEYPTEDMKEADAEQEEAQKQSIIDELGAYVIPGLEFWYDTDAELIFSLSFFPPDDGSAKMTQYDLIGQAEAMGPM